MIGVANDDLHEVQSAITVEKGFTVADISNLLFEEASEFDKWGRHEFIPPVLLI